MYRKQEKHLFYFLSDSRLFWGKGNVSRRNSLFLLFQFYMSPLYSGGDTKKKSPPHIPKGRECQESMYFGCSHVTPFLILLTSLTFYTNPLSFLSNSSFFFFFLKQRSTHRKRVRGLDTVAICNTGMSPSRSQ